MRRIKLTIEYFGAPFAGWQVQPDQRTVQGVLEDALKTVTHENIRLYVAGRTDAGVHATAQIAHFDTATERSLEQLQTSLNHFGKPNIAVTHIEEVAADFHARFSATARHYCYKILNRPTPSPIHHLRALHVREPLNVPAMQKALVGFEGELDCTSLRSRHCQSSTPMCFIHYARLEHHGELIELHLCANHFLHNMVRIITGTLVDIGRGNRPPEDFMNIIAAKDRTQASDTIAPHGLYLTKVDY
jgi:tRNA pseudouridine38-40 synthase